MCSMVGGKAGELECKGWEWKGPRYMDVSCPGE